MKPQKATARPTPDPKVGSVSGAPTAESSAAPRAAPQTLEAPPTVRQPLGDAPPAQTRREVQGQVGLRARPARVGRRQKKLKTERVEGLNRLERPAFARVTADIAGALASVRPDEGARGDLAALGARLEPMRGTLWTGVQQALRGTRSGLTRSGIDTLRTTGVDALVFRALVDGRLTSEAVDEAREHLMAGLRAGELPVSDVKKALVTADGLLQRLALADFPVTYGFENNGPRDLLLVFASALHR